MAECSREHSVLSASVSAPQAGHIHTPCAQTSAKKQMRKTRKDRRENGIYDIKIYGIR